MFFTLKFISPISQILYHTDNSSLHSMFHPWLCPTILEAPYSRGAFQFNKISHLHPYAIMRFLSRISKQKGTFKNCLHPSPSNQKMNLAINGMPNQAIVNNLWIVIAAVQMNGWNPEVIPEASASSSASQCSSY